MDFVEVDGSVGEGGGQVLRTSVAFSSILDRPIRVFKIRGGRGVPGLKRQHVSALTVISDIFGGELKGATEGSSEITFIPGRKRNAAIRLDMGTAASITLVLQAVIPAVALTGSSLVIDLIGGTDVPWSPTFDYFQRVVREAFRVIGISFSTDASRRGYYPKGGGRVSTRVEPSISVNSLEMIEGPWVDEARLVSRCAGLPRHVAERQLSSASEVIETAGIQVTKRELVMEESASPGSSVLAYSVGTGCLLGGDGIGARGRSAEEVGEHAAMKFVKACRSGACMDSNVADMVIPFLAIAPKNSKIRVHSVSEHLNSGLQLARKFTSCDWSVTAEGASFIVNVSPGILDAI